MKILLITVSFPPLLSIGRYYSGFLLLGVLMNGFFINHGFCMTRECLIWYETIFIRSLTMKCFLVDFLIEFSLGCNGLKENERSGNEDLCNCGQENWAERGCSVGITDEYISSPQTSLVV